MQLDAEQMQLVRLINAKRSIASALVFVLEQTPALQVFLTDKVTPARQEVTDLEALHIGLFKAWGLPTDGTVTLMEDGTVIEPLARANTRPEPREAQPEVVVPAPVLDPVLPVEPAIASTEPAQ